MEIKISAEILEGYEGKTITKEILENYDNTIWVKVDDVIELLKEVYNCGECPFCNGDDIGKGYCYNFKNFLKKYIAGIK